MGGRRLDPERAHVLLGCLDAGMNPNRAAGAAGVSKSVAYRVDRERSGGPGRLAARRAAAARRPAAARAGRKVAPQKVRELLGLVAGGLSANRAAKTAGVSKSFAYGLVKKMGGVRTRPEPESYCPRYLSREERYEIARLRDAGLGVRAVAARIGRLAVDGQPRAGPQRGPARQRLPARAGAPDGPGPPAAAQAVEAVAEPGAARGGAGHAGAQVLTRAGQREAEGDAPRRPVDARQPRDDLPVDLRLPPRGAQARAAGLPALRARPAQAAGAPRGARQDHRRGPARAAPDRGGGPAGARPPRGRPGHGVKGVQLRGRDDRGADDRLPHPAPPPARAHRRRRRQRRHRPGWASTRPGSPAL